VVKLLVGKSPVAVRANDCQIVVILPPRDVVQLQNRGIRLAAANADRIFGTEPPQPLLPAVFFVR
jgi:hypothetical protein